MKYQNVEATVSLNSVIGRRFYPFIGNSIMSSSLNTSRLPSLRENPMDSVKKSISIEQ